MSDQKQKAQMTIAAAILETRLDSMPKEALDEAYRGHPVIQDALAVLLANFGNEMAHIILHLSEEFDFDPNGEKADEFEDVMWWLTAEVICGHKIRFHSEREADMYTCLTAGELGITYEDACELLDIKPKGIIDNV